MKVKKLHFWETGDGERGKDAYHKAHSKAMHQFVKIHKVSKIPMIASEVEDKPWEPKFILKCKGTTATAKEDDPRRRSRLQ